jgi:hypothetical protein
MSYSTHTWWDPRAGSNLIPTKSPPRKSLPRGPDERLPHEGTRVRGRRYELHGGPGGVASGGAPLAEGAASGQAPVAPPARVAKDLLFVAGGPASGGAPVARPARAARGGPRLRGRRRGQRWSSGSPAGARGPRRTLASRSAEDLNLAAGGAARGGGWLAAWLYQQDCRRDSEGLPLVKDDEHTGGNTERE